MKAGFVTFDRDRSDKTGSARIRAGNLIKYEPDFELFSTAKKFDAVVFQKYYWHDYARLFQGVKILDICDPDWLEGSPNIEIVRLLQDIDGVVANTPATAEYMRKLTDKPVVVIPDRHDMAIMKERHQNTGKPAKKAIWFGYSHNTHTLRLYITKLMEHGIDLTIMAEKFVSISGSVYNDFKPHEHFVKFPSDMTEANRIMIQHDFALLPISRRPQDQYKSNNKTTHAWAVGLPVANWGDDIDRLIDAAERKRDADEHYQIAHRDYDCKDSAREYKGFITDLMAKK